MKDSLLEGGWHTWRTRARRRSRIIWLMATPRGLRHDPDRTRAKYLRKRARQGKDRR